MVSCKMLRYFGASLLSALLGLMPALAHADKLDDNLQTVWESLWDERGTPRSVVRWDQPISFTVSGQNSEQHRAHIQKAMLEAARWSGLEVTEAPLAPGEPSNAVLQFEIVRDDGLPDTMPCVTQPRFANWAFTKVVVRMQSKSAWRCTYHEVMHVMGVAGHPSGKTVLSYFPYRRDEFMELDKLMLKAWYDPAMARGATPLEALLVLTNEVANQTDLNMSRDLALQRSRIFNLAAVEQVKALASGNGEIPAIVQRSGRASSQFIEAARPQAAFLVALAYLRGTIVGRDVAAASHWAKVAAQKGHLAGQLMLARALIRGEGTAVDMNAAHGWLSLAVKSNNSVARRELESLEKSMSIEQLDMARGTSLPAVITP